jgi:hypothetical protein
MITPTAMATMSLSGLAILSVPAANRGSSNKPVVWRRKIANFKAA